MSIAATVGCVVQTLHDWATNAEVDRGMLASVPTDIAGTMRWSARTASCAKPTKSCERHKLILRRWSEPKPIGAAHGATSRRSNTSHSKGSTN